MNGFMKKMVLVGMLGAAPLAFAQSSGSSGTTGSGSTSDQTTGSGSTTGSSGSQTGSGSTYGGSGSAGSGSQTGSGSTYGGSGSAGTGSSYGSGSGATARPLLVRLGQQRDAGQRLHGLGLDGQQHLGDRSTTGTGSTTPDTTSGGTGR